MFPWPVTHVNDSGFPVFERGKRAKHSTGYRGTGRPSGQLKDDKSVVKEARRISKDPRQRLRSRKLRSAQCPRHTLGSPPRHQHNSKPGSGTTGTTATGSTIETHMQSNAHRQQGGHAYGKGSNKAPRGRRDLHECTTSRGTTRPQQRRHARAMTTPGESTPIRRTTTPVERRHRPWTLSSPLPSVTANTTPP